MEGWIKVHRRITEWEWYSDHNTARVFMHLLMTVTHKGKKWRGIELKPGERIIGRKELARECGLTEKNIRTCLKNLISTGEVASKSTNKFSILTIVKWEEFQSNEDELTNEAASKRPASGQQAATIKNVKNEKKEGESRAYTHEASPPPPPENENENLRKEPPPPSPQKIPQWAIVSLQKRQEKGEKLSESEQQIMANYLKSIGIEEPKKPPELAYSRDNHAKQLIFQRDKLGRGYLFSKNELEIIEEYEQKKSNNNIILTGVLHHENQEMQLLQRAI